MDHHSRLLHSYRSARLAMLWGLLLLLAPPCSRAQYEKYSFRGFPRADLAPLTATYSLALEHYEGESWREAVRLLEHSLRLHRLLRDSEAACGRECGLQGTAGTPEPEEGWRWETTEPLEGWHRELLLFRRLLHTAVCLRKCKQGLPAFQVTYPGRDTLRDFQRREPYQYLHYALFKANKIEKAVSAAHTYLQKNPKHEMTLRYMNYYKSLLDVDEFLIDIEAHAYEAIFVKAVKSYNSGDFSSSTAGMEQALSEYYKAYENCLAGCAGSYEVKEMKDFYPAIADLFVDVLRCKVDCETNLTPNVGGFFVEKFVATMYHYLQFAYYKLNDIKNAVQCVSSYILFDSKDDVMQRNLVYYRFYKEQWNLQEEDFHPREEAVRYHNRTTIQRSMLEFAEHHLQPDDEMEVGAEEAMADEDTPSDSEFEGEGDYEEGIYAEGWRDHKVKGDKADKSN